MKAVDGEDAQDQVVERQDSRFGRVHGAALILLAGSIALAPRGPFLLAYAVAAIAWLFVMRRELPFRIVLVIAIVLRLPFFVHEPSLSGDVYRYLSDGRVVAQLENPYAYTPTDPRINHPEIRSIYPPHAQLLFGALHTLPLWRLLLLACDLGVLVLLRRRGALAYATCPLVLIEGVWNGHIDLVAAALLAYAFARGSGVAAGIAVGMKLIPLAAMPALWKRIQPLSFLAALLLPILPFVRGPIMPGFRDYATRWIFNSPLYDGIRFVVERIPTKTIWTHHPLRFEAISDVVYRHLFPDFLTRAMLATIALGAIVLARRASTGIAALLLCSPAIHPWYWLTLVPLALMERTPWLWFALAAPVSYLLYDDAPPIAIYAICYGVPAFACVASRFFSSPSRSST